MAQRFTKRIIAHLADDRYVRADAEEMARQLQVRFAELDVFAEELHELVVDGKIEVGANDRLQLPALPSEVEGSLHITQRGFGFISTDSPYREGDLFVPERSIGGAISGDRVLARVLRRDGRRGRGAVGHEGRVSGRIIEVIKRNRTRFTGTIAKQRGSWFVLPDGRDLREPILVRDASAKNVKEGDKVVLDIVHFPSGDHVAEGVITEVLGEAGQPDVETRAVIANFGLATDFSEEIVNEARESATSFDSASADDAVHEPTDRLDLRDLLTFTIDPPDARDFDDAISLEYDEENDAWELGIHIADVAHFVRSEGDLDKEAFERGNSVYLPELVIPMLPELLSNGVCSLQEGVNRFCKSVFIRYDNRGRLLGHRYHRSVIRSNKRLTYLEAQALIDGNEALAAKHTRAKPNYSDELTEALRRCEKLARMIRKQRFDSGMLSLSLPSSVLQFDDEGHVTGAEQEDDAFTHTIIEMFMVAANEAVAALFAGLEVPLLRRIHPDPDFGYMDAVREYARLIQFRFPEQPTRHDLQSLVKASTGTPFERAIHTAVLKSLTKACYSPALVGHFALASDHYAHFTSPIRRYPDLTVHREIDAYLDVSENGTKNLAGKSRRKTARLMEHDARCLGDETLLDIGTHCSATEVNASAAERSLRTFLVMQFLATQDPGETWKGTVTGTTSGGAVFVMLEDFLVDGLVPAAEMPGADKGHRWQPAGRTDRLVAVDSGLSIGVGDPVQVQIVSIELAARQMNLQIVSFKPTQPLKGEMVGGGEGARTKYEREQARPGGARKHHKNKRKGYKMGRRGKRSW